MTKVWRVGHAENQQEFIMLQYTIGGKPTEFRQYCCDTVANSRRYTLQSRNDAHDSTYESKCGGLAMAAARRRCATRAHRRRGFVLGIARRRSGRSCARTAAHETATRRDIEHGGKQA
ncbi:hypothetical protein [Burkholderia thailandensis]|uniref:hypothetical protein n=1 Tax=Burkholderia thailandensis TaxID=57975 RepID=UPI0005F0EAE6|nr:hypothetical protein AQ477_14000 [Burkholderia thailandensis]KXF61616.1 hypothetical protein AQ476_10125 [Burkholderia thailandensis]PNE74299.1 hypothetical protein A8H37_20990 [Burkholderia thailandensis]